MNHTSKVIIEKYKKWDYIDSAGYFVWTNRYGDIINEEDVNGNPKHTFSEAGYIYVPYVMAFVTPEIIHSF